MIYPAIVVFGFNILDVIPLIYLLVGLLEDIKNNKGGEIVKKIIQVNDDYEILHSHCNFQRETDFVAWNIKAGMFNATHLRKPNCMINWKAPLNPGEIDWLISK